MKTGYSGSLLPVIMLFLISGCASQGAKRLPADRFDYNAAISQSSTEQMLLNIVRSRYQEMLVFLDVNSVVAQYTYDRSASVGYFREFINNSIAPTSDTASVDANVGYSELPTITYSPISGEAFAKQLYTTMPIELFFAAAHSGFSIGLMMQIGIQRIGEVENMPFSEIRRARNVKADLEKLARFARAIDFLQLLSNEKAIEVQIVKGDEKKGTATEQFLVFSDELPVHLQPTVEELRQLLGLSHKHKRFRLIERTADLADDEISSQARSIMAMIKFLSKGVQVPAAQLKSGWVVDYELTTPTHAETVDRLFPLIVHSSKSHPGDVYAAVRYRDYWYYINHDDITSKRALEHLMILFHVNAPASESAAPLLTLPTR